MRYLIVSIILFYFSCSDVNTLMTLSTLESPASESSSLPRLFTDNTGMVFMSWVETANDTSTLFYSSLEDEKWSEPTKIASSDQWFVNWADFPSVIAKDGKAVAAHWLKKTPGGTYSYDVEIASALNNWETSIVPHTDGTATEHGFVSLTPASDSTFLAIWLDGRNTAGHGGHDNHGSSSDLSTAMTLRSALIDKNLTIINQTELDNSVCDCCGTAAVKTENGFITAYRDRTENEIRDISVARYRNGSWLKPEAVHNDNWEIAACPVNGPAIAAKGNKVALTWYTAANDTSKVKVSFSDNEGESFGQPITIDYGQPLGRVDIEFISDEKVLVSWMERNTQDRSKANFIVKELDFDGNIVNEHIISEMSSSRRSGFPQITAYKNGIIAAWTNFEDDKPSRVKTAKLE